MSVKDDLTALCELEAEIAHMSEYRDDLRRRLLEHALEAYESEGAAPTWRTELGTVGLTVPKTRVEVIDEDAFFAAAYSILGAGAIEHVTRVRPDQRQALLASVDVTPTGVPVTADGEPVAGVVARPRPPYLTVRLKKAS